MSRTLISFCGSLALLTACSASNAVDATDPPACTASLVPAIVLSVRDAQTQAPAATGVVVDVQHTNSSGVTLQEQAGRSDSLHIWIGASSGTFNLILKKAGYSDLLKNGIVVPAADSLDCHPKTVSLDVLLQPGS